MKKKNKVDIVSSVIYVFAIINFIAYLITKKSAYMASGGVCLIVASLIVICMKNKK